MNLAAVENELTSYVEQHADRLVQILQDIVRIPSENTPPIGSEGECQKYIARFLSDWIVIPSPIPSMMCPG